MRTLLFILVAFTAVTSILSGVLIITDPHGGLLKLPLNLLDGTPFPSFLLPGIILMVVVGGVNLAAWVHLAARHLSRYNWCLAAGLVLSGWILVQMMMVKGAGWLQFLYLAIGIMTVLIAYSLKGKWAV